MTGEKDNTITVRRKKPEDNETVMEVILDGFGEKYLAMCGGREEAMRKILSGELEWRGRDGNMLVAEVGGRVCGVVELLASGMPGVPDDVIINLRLKHLGIGLGTRAMYLTSVLGGPSRPGDCMISHLCVSCDTRRRGTGRALIAGANEVAAEHGYDRLSLWVDEKNTPAIRLYESEGFEETEKLKSRTSGRFFGIPVWLKMCREVP